MKWKQPVQHIPGGEPLPGVSAGLRRVSDGTTVDMFKSDDAGYITVQRDGHLEPVYLHLQDAAGGDKIARSDETHRAGPTCPSEWPMALRALGDGVITGYGGQLDCMVGPTSYSVLPGAALVYGHPVVIYTGLSNVPLARPTSGTALYRVVIRLYPTGSPTTPGKADLALLGPTTGSAPAVTQTPTVWEMPLATITVPSSGTPTCLNERTLLGDATIVVGSSKPPSASTATGGAGVDIPASAVTLSLPVTTPYTVTARLSGEQFGTAIVWAEIQTVGLGTTTPLSFAKTPNGGWIYVADYTRNLVMRFDANGTYYGAVGGLQYVRGIAADDNYVYVGYWDSNYQGATVAKFGHDLAGPYARCFINTGYPYSLAVTPTYAGTGWCGTSANTVRSFSPATMAVTGSISFSDPEGMTYNPADACLYIVYRAGKAVYKYRGDLTYILQFGGFTDPLGIDANATGQLVVADLGAGLVRRVNTSGVPLDTFASAGAIDIVNYPGDVIWVLDYSNAVMRKFDQTTPGYGSLAIDLNGTVSPFLGIGNRGGSFSNVAAATVQGPATITVKGKLRADANTVNVQGIALSVTATPQD